MTYVQFYHNSTGYIAGSIPPQFSDENIKPIEMCGTDGVFILDGRNNIDTMVFDAEKRMSKMRMIHPDICGYKIIKAQKFSDIGTTLFSTIKNEQKWKPTKQS